MDVTCSEIRHEPAICARTACFDCVCIAAIFALPLLILRPLQNAPFVDDWIYHWSVQRFLKTGELLIPEISTCINPVQIVLGALCCLPFGEFSFAGARFSTWALGASALCATYLLAREFGLSRARALLAAAVLGSCPLFFILSVTFMTDVGFMAMATWSTFAMVRALRKRSDGWLIASALLAMLAGGFRLPAVVLPVAGCLALIAKDQSWGRRTWRCAVVLSPLLVVGLLLVWNRHHQFVSVDLSEVPNSPARRVENLKYYAIQMLPRTLPNSALWAIAMSGACLLPLVITGLGMSRPVLYRAGAVFALMLIACLVLRAFGEGVAMPLASGSTWSIDELGASISLAPGSQPVRWQAPWMVAALFCVFLAAGAIVWCSTIFRRPVKGEAVLRWTVVGHVALAAILWLFYDRYILPILPPLIVMTLLSQKRIRLGAAVAGVAVFAAISLIGTRDHLAYNGALWETVRGLHARGIRPGDIDAGYVVNGWFQYGDPASAPNDEAGNAYVPWVTKDGPLPYLVTGQPKAGYAILSERRINRWIGPDFSLYVLRRL